MKGWFDLSRVDGGPTLYSHANRTTVTGDVTTAALFLAAGTLFIAFLVIFPGVRKERFTTFSSVTFSLFVGTAILVTCQGSSWHVAKNQVTATYRAFSKERLRAEVGAYIGLQHVNITLRALPEVNQTEAQDIDFNERFSWGGAGDMRQGYREGLVRGLPFPLLTVAEALSLGQEGFSWGGQYRRAGYYCAILLWASFAAWCVTNLLLIVVPRYGAYCLAGTGSLMLVADAVYWSLLPRTQLMVRFEGAELNFSLGWCFWLVLAAGALSVLFGLVIAVFDMLFPHRFSTVLEVDYDTPYDRHIIIEESRGKPSLERPSAFGSRILRRLSRRDTNSKQQEEQRQLQLQLQLRQGLDNDAFELDPPKSPWRYPFQREPRQPRLQPPRVAAFRRTDSQDSASSTASSVRVSFSNLPPPQRQSSLLRQHQEQKLLQQQQQQLQQQAQPQLQQEAEQQEIKIPSHPALRRSTAGLEDRREVAMW
ncbi:dual oxidase maturation factor 1 [Frankliniella occidentalis]|uniref:Dual oxidase maturation factor 1 n=1 Tax=Frankliniella occidentalis TaxID=133901 RepID=A0A9C6X302_FRAOC|nr:dual oxidase maturation factor 1 [Frankliniella occidentalis]